MANTAVPSALLLSISAESDKSGQFGALSFKKSCAVKLNDFLDVPSQYLRLAGIPAEGDVHLLLLGVTKVGNTSALPSNSLAMKSLVFYGNKARLIWISSTAG